MFLCGKKVLTKMVYPLHHTFERCLTIQQKPYSNSQRQHTVHHNVKKLQSTTSKYSNRGSSTSPHSNITPEDGRTFEEEVCRAYDITDDVGTVTKHDFVLVKFVTKKTQKYYVGQVLDIEASGEYYVNFMRRKPPGYFFIFPDVQDASQVSADDTIKLPAPCTVEGDAKVHRMFKFPISFEKIVNVN